MKSILPSVVIGLGGTGVKTITYLKKNLYEYAPDVAEFVRFLAIDIDEIRGEVAPASLFGAPIRLDPEKNEALRIVNQTRDSQARNIPSISSWFPEEAYKYLPLTEGARQAKPIGRLGFFLGHDQISRAMHRLTDRVVTPAILNRFPGLRPGELNIYIVASICGGTGAGLFLDMAYELRYLQTQAELPEKTRIKGLFALGDVYDAISERVLANTYASLRELNWAQGEHVAFHPVYPSGTRDVIHSKAYDSIYLFGSSNASDIEFESPDDFAQLCADFIFLDSGADAQETGDSLSAMIQSVRNNSEVYTMNYDADGTPRCYSSLGLCKIRFPAERVAELCAARMAREIIEHHIAGRLSEDEHLEARRKVQDFLSTEGFTCTKESNDLLNRLVEKQLNTGERVPLDSWITQNLSRAFNDHLEGIRNLEIGRINQVVNTLNGEIATFQEDMGLRTITELQTFNGVVEQAIQRMFRENLGVSFVARFLQELHEQALASRDFAQQELRELTGRERRHEDQMGNHLRELANLLEGGLLRMLRMEARRAQLRETYRAIRQNMLNRVNTLKMRAAIDFYDGVYNNAKRLIEGGDGAIERLAQQILDIRSIQDFVSSQAQNFRDAYERNKRIQGSPFEILIYDNTTFSEVNELFDAVYTDTLRARLFEEVLSQIGGTIWDIRNYIGDERAHDELRHIFISVAQPPFAEEVEKQTVAQRIIAAKTRASHPVDYEPRLQTAYDVADYFCQLNNSIASFAELRYSEQAVTAIVIYIDDGDTAFNAVRSMLRQSMARGGSVLPFTHTSDKHSILIYREFSGFPAYTLSRIRAYYNNYVSEARRENSPPLQMLTQESLLHIDVPNQAVLSKFDVMVIEALTLGVIISDDQYYYMVTPDEWKRRKLAEEAQARGGNVPYEDRMAGSDRRLGTRLTEVVSKMSERLPEQARMSADQETYANAVEQQNRERTASIERNMRCDLFEALYFENYPGTARERIDLNTTIRPVVTFLLRRDFALEERHIHRPEASHQEMLRRVYIRSDEAG